MEKIENVLAKEMKRLENSRDVLEMLSMLKKGYTDKANPQIKIQLAYIEKGICPFCLNQIDWSKLKNLIMKYNKELELAHKQLKKMNKK